MRLIDADKLKDNIVITDPNGMTSSDMYRINQLKKWIDNQPTVEAISKADYETRLKADMVAMLTELQTEIDMMSDSVVEGRTVTITSWKGMQKKICNIIQQKINALKGE